MAAGISRRALLQGTAAAGVLVGAGAGVLALRRGGDDGRPSYGTNVLLLMMDDARQDVLEAMPTVRAYAERGVTFTNARSASPICRPARAGLFAGRYPFRTGIFDNSSEIDPARFDHAETVGRWMQRAGRHTMFVGKYGVSPERRSTADGWDTLRQQRAADDQLHRGLRFWDGTAERVVDEWHVSYQLAEIKAHIERAGDRRQPWYVHWTPNVGHWPFEAPGRDLGTTPVERVPQDGEGWPPWVEARPRLTDSDWTQADGSKRLQHLEAADLDDRLAALDPDLDDTVVIVTSDNGLHYGDHRFSGPGTKNTIYEPACKVPLVIAGPGFPRGVEVDVPVVLQDVTATVLAAAGGTAPVPLDGIDLAAVAADPAAHADRAVLVQRRASDLPPADVVCTRTRKLARHTHQGATVYEMYDLDTDPGELVNVADDPARLEERSALEARLDELLTS